MAIKTAARWLSLTVILLTAFGLMGAGRPAPQAYPNVTFVMEVVPSQAILRPLCEGQSQDIFARVVRKVSVPHGEPVQAAIFGAAFEATVENPSIGAIGPLGGYDNDPSGAYIQYLFTGQKAGHTFIRFAADVGLFWTEGGQQGVASNPVRPEVLVAVTVRKCTAMASSVQRWQGDNYFLIGDMPETKAAADDHGNLAGSGTINWASHVTNVFGCEKSISIDDYAPSRVDLTGQMDDSGNLSLKLDFQPVVDSVTIHCLDMISRAWTVMQYSVTDRPDALSVNIPASSDAVIVSRPQTIRNVKSNASDTGNLTLIVQLEQAATGSAQIERQSGRLGFADRSQFWPAAQQAFSAWAR